METIALYDEVVKLVELAAASRAELFQAVQHHPESPYRDRHDHPVSDHIEAIRKNVAAVNAIIEKVRKSSLSHKQREQFEHYVEERGHYVSDGLLPACDAILAGDFHRANDILLDKALPMSVIAMHEAESFGHIGVAEKSLLEMTVFFGLVMVAIGAWVGYQLF